MSTCRESNVSWTKTTVFFPVTITQGQAINFFRCPFDKSWNVLHHLFKDIALKKKKNPKVLVNLHLITFSYRCKLQDTQMYYLMHLAQSMCLCVMLHNLKYLLFFERNLFSLFFFSYQGPTSYHRLSKFQKWLLCAAASTPHWGHGKLFSGLIVSSLGKECVFMECLPQKLLPKHWHLLTELQQRSSTNWSVLAL